MTTKHTPYTTTSQHALTVWSPIWWVPSLVWVPADLYGSQYRSIAQDTRSTESSGLFGSHFPGTGCTPVILLHHQNPAAAKHRLSDPFWFKTDVTGVLTQHTFPPYQRVLQFSKSTALITYIFWNVYSSLKLHCQEVQEYPWLFLNCLTMKTNASWSFNMPETIHLTTWSYNPEDLKLQQHQCKNLKPHIIFNSPYLTGLTDYLFQIKVAKLLNSGDIISLSHNHITAGETTILTNVTILFVLLRTLRRKPILITTFVQQPHPPPPPLRTATLMPTNCIDMIYTPQQILLQWSIHREWDEWGMWQEWARTEMHTAFWWETCKKQTTWKTKT
jgi:hypothetical protein